MMATVDLDRRFSGLDRLWGTTRAESVRRAHVVVVGVGGVGSWCVEALARSGVGHLTLIEGEGGVGLLYAAEGGLYLPPLVAIQDRPFFPLLVYNFLKPYREARTGLLAPEETLLPTPEAGFLPRERGGGGRLFALLAALVLLLEALRFGRRA